jgi:hypothetical protein
MRGYLDTAEQLLLNEKETESNFDIYYKHIRTEQLWSRYMQLNSFSTYYSVAERSILIDEFESIAFYANLKEHNHACKGANAGQITKFLQSMRSSLV